MNKLYKYLPYNIKGVVKDEESTTPLTCYLKGILQEDNLAIYTEENSTFKETCLIDDFKPMLRPLSDLSKKLTLTKAAAEIVNLEEGNFITISEFFPLESNLITFSLNEFILWKSTKNPLLNLYNSRVIKNQDVLIKNNSMIDEINIIKNKESFLNFLRAMMFAVDFQENEYIKLV